MLLVDDDQAQVGDGREHRRARPDADARLAAAQTSPLVVALAGAQLRVQDGDGVAEAGLEAGDRLRGQGDLGHEHDPRARGRAPPRRRQVDLGLARTGDAVKQELGGLAGRHRGLDPLCRRLLRRCERRSGDGRGADDGGRGTAAHGALLEDDKAAVGQAAQPAVVEGEVGGGERAGGERLEHGALARGERRAFGAASTPPPPPPRALRDQPPLRPLARLRPSGPTPGGSTRPSARAGVEQ